MVDNDTAEALSFNGATSFQMWIGHGTDPEQGDASRLQWGHILSDVDSPQHPGTPVPKGSQLQWGHILSDVDSPAATLSTARLFSFNGATSFQMWIVTTEPSFVVFFCRLQWGHILSDVDSGRLYVGVNTI